MREFEKTVGISQDNKTLSGWGGWSLGHYGRCSGLDAPKPEIKQLNKA